MPALKQDGGRPRISVTTNSTTPNNDPFKGIEDTINGFLHDLGNSVLNVGPKPGAMASNQYLHDHGAGSILRRK